LVPDQHDKAEGNVYNATIPPFPDRTNVTYIIMAEDNAGNVTSVEVGYQCQYQAIAEFLQFVIMTLLMTLTLPAVTVCPRKHI